MPEAQFQNLCLVISDIDFKDETLSMDQYQNQGDYDGSGQQSCKCNYVDFSK